MRPQEFGGWKSTEVMERVCSKVRSEEVAPEMRAAVSRAGAHLGVGEFLEVLWVDLTLVEDSAVCLPRRP